MKAFGLVIFICLAAWAQDSGVAVEVTLERLNDTQWRAVDPRLVMHGGDEVRFRFRSNQPGYLYVINHDAQGRNTWLFPTPETGEQNTVEPNKDYVIPATAGVFQIAARPGYETTYWILSPQELQGRKSMNRAIIKSDQTPLLPRCGSGPLVARGPCTDDNAGAHRSRTVAIPKWFENVGPLQPRDMTVDNSGEQSHINSPGAFETPLIYEFRIAHQ